MIFAYNNNQMFLPNNDKIFGSHSVKVDSPANYKDGGVNSYYQEFDISRTRWMNLDQAESRCSPHKSEVNTTKCITEYLENRIGCSMGLQGTDTGLRKYAIKCISTKI